MPNKLEAVTYNVENSCCFEGHTVSQKRRWGHVQQTAQYGCASLDLSDSNVRRAARGDSEVGLYDRRSRHREPLPTTNSNSPREMKRSYEE